MCGVLTCVCKQQGLDARVVSSLGLMSHRGPDSQNIYLSGREGSRWLRNLNGSIPPETEGLGAYNIAMGHCRLSIIDLSEGSNQPMTSEDGEFILSYNGEIYNYIELRDRLAIKGERFRTKSDTEVLLKSLMRYGTGALREMNGMWALTLLDLNKKKIILARDRYGKKPLFYYNGPDYFIAASEIKSIFHILGSRRALDPDFLSAFISFNFWPNFDNGRTLYKGIMSLEAGSSLTYDIATGRAEAVKDNSIQDFTESPLCADELAQEINTAVKLRLRADVPMGILVSGGVDSSTVAAHVHMSAQARDVIWYAGETGDGNDTKYAEMLARCMGVELRKIVLRPDIGSDLAEQLTYHYEMPLLFLGNSIAMFQMYQRIAADGVKVVLDGTGGDEIFGGYFDHYNRGILKTLLEEKEVGKLCEFIYSSMRFGNIPAKKMFKDALYQFARAVVPSRRFSGGSKRYQRLDNKGFLFKRENNPSGDNDHYGLIDVQRYDITKGRLPNWLYMNDQNSLASSVEVRSPFLDYRLAKYINLPFSSKFSDGYNKLELRKAMPPVIGDNIRWRRDKQGFRWSPLKFLKANSTEIRKSILNSEIVSALFEKSELEKKLKAGSSDDGCFFLRLYAVSLLEKVFKCTL